MSIYKTFREVQQPATMGAISPRFDQPTYLSFKLGFGIGGDSWYNNAGGTNYALNYDRMPHPLFAQEGNESIDNRGAYSAIDYLLDANEFTRAAMLKEFIEKFNQLQTKNQWYFQKIEGLNDLLKIDPTKGIRVPSDKRLTISTLEGIDLRMSYLLNMYRKIAWDDTYQRWVLPDMMRYFTLTIYISEFRTFHTPNQIGGMGFASKKITPDEDTLQLHVLDKILPTWTIKCEMCEFDLENIDFEYLSTLGINEAPEPAAVNFKIKVGKIYEEQTYPIFYNAYLIDRYLNGLDRSKYVDLFKGDEEFGINLKQGGGIEGFVSTLAESNNNASRYEHKLNLAQDIFFQDKMHESGLPFNQMINSKSLFGAQAAGADGKLFTEDDNMAKVDPTAPNTWFNNAKSFGTAFLRNTFKKFIDKAKITPIPKLGISFNEAQAALQSKNIITALGIIKKAVNNVTKEYVQPSELLEDNIQDKIFKNYLESVVASEATENNALIQEAANMALNDDGVWDKIKDFSRATDLIGEGELNANNPIEGKDNYKLVSEKSTQGDLSLATDLIGEGEKNIEKKIEGRIIETVPSSQATSGTILEI